MDDEPFYVVGCVECGGPTRSRERIICETCCSGAERLKRRMVDPSPAEIARRCEILRAARERPAKMPSVELHVAKLKGVMLQPDRGFG